MQPKREPEPDSKFVRAAPEEAMEVVAKKMTERSIEQSRPTIYGPDKNPHDEESINEILAEIHEKNGIPGDKNNGYLLYIKKAFKTPKQPSKQLTDPEKEILWTEQINYYLNTLSPDELKKFRLYGPQYAQEKRTFFSPSEYNQYLQGDRAAHVRGADVPEKRLPGHLKGGKKQVSEYLKANLKRKRKHKKRRKSKKRKSKKKTKRK
jgi:hypothetical protein